MRRTVGSFGRKMEELEVSKESTRKNWGDSSMSPGWKRFWIFCGVGEAIKISFCSIFSCSGTVFGFCTIPSSCGFMFGVVGCLSGCFLWIFSSLLFIGSVVTCFIPSLIPFIGWFFLSLVLVLIAISVVLCFFGLSCVVFVPLVGLCLGVCIALFCPLTGCVFLLFPNPSLLLLIKLFGLFDVDDETPENEELKSENLNERNERKSNRRPTGKNGEIEIELNEKDIEHSNPKEEVVPLYEAIAYSSEVSQKRQDDDEKFELDTKYLKAISRKNSPEYDEYSFRDREIDETNDDQSVSSDEEIIIKSLSNPPQSIMGKTEFQDHKKMNIVTTDDINEDNEENNQYDDNINYPTSCSDTESSNSEIEDVKELSSLEEEISQSKVDGKNPTYIQVSNSNSVVPIE